MMYLILTAKVDCSACFMSVIFNSLFLRKFPLTSGNPLNSNDWTMPAFYRMFEQMGTPVSTIMKLQCTLASIPLPQCTLLF